MSDKISEIFSTACRSCDFPEWHRGRKHYAVWVIELTDPAFLDVLSGAQRRFSDLLLRPYHRQAHITVSIGGFMTRDAMEEDDYSDFQRSQDVHRLGSSQLSSFSITLGPLDTFSTALYLHVLDSGGSIATIRQLLNRGWSEGRTTPYVPHVTVGLYAKALPMADIQRRIADSPMHASHTCHVNSLSLMCYEASVMGGPLERIETVNLVAHK